MPIFVSTEMLAPEKFRRTMPFLLVSVNGPRGVDDEARHCG